MKEYALERTLWRTRFRRGYRPAVLRQATLIVISTHFTTNL